MSFDDTIKAYFVTTNESGKENEQYAKDLKEAFNCLKIQLAEQHIRQLKASEGYPLIASGTLTKKDVFVFDRFDGDFFEQLQQTKCLIIGARCLIQCLESERPIPQGTSPVYTVAMRDLKISGTGLTAQEKSEISKYIHWMGGHYFHNFGRGITHLVSNTIKSTKYEHATLNGIPVMHVDWVQRVWERSCVANINATNAEFDKYRLPIFFGINVTCTGLNVEKKNEIMRLVNENGGTFHRAFRSQQVDIVITEKDNTQSEKYQAAVRYKKDILLPEWIFDSVENGFALPTKDYRVKTFKVSTPTKADQSIADFSITGTTDISRISVASSKRCNETVNESTARTSNTLIDSPGIKTVQQTASTSKALQRELLQKKMAYRLVYEEICPQQAKKAGTFLDGCCIYLSGFCSEEREKLNRILNVGGATRYDVVNEKITHIIVGQPNDAEFRSWQRSGYLTGINVVRLDWLLESIKLKQAACENVYRVSLPNIREPDAPSPSSKRTLRSMNHSFKQPGKPIKKKLFLHEDATALELPAVVKPLANSTELNVPDEEHQLLAQYSQNNTAATPLPPASQTSTTSSVASAIKSSNDSTLMPAASSTKLQPNASALTEGSVMHTIDYEHLNFFAGMTLYMDKQQFPEEFYTQMVCECESAQGNLVPATFRDPVDYAIVSFERAFDATKLPVNARHIVTELYVECCLKENRLLPIEYYHKHIPHTADVQPLLGMTIVISLYSGLERDFIDALAHLLGAKVNSAFVKRERALLICHSPEGSKYHGAIKWHYPVVHSEYLVQCAQRGKKLSYAAYLVGNSVEDFPISTPEMRNKACSTALPTVEQTPEITPLRNKRVSELLGQVPTDSPHTPSNNAERGPYNFEILEQFVNEIEDSDKRECLRDILLEMHNNQTPELERIRRQAYTPINRKIPTPKGIPAFCTTPEFEQRMIDEFERRWQLPIKKLKPDTPIDQIRRRIIVENCRLLGLLGDDENEPPTSSTAQTTPIYHKPSTGTRLRGLSVDDKNEPSTSSTAQTTPLFHKPTTGSINMEPRAIFAQPRTSTEATETSGRASDTFVPDTQSPNNSILLQRVSMGKSTTINFDKISFDETELQAEVENGRNSINKIASSDFSSPEARQISEYLKNCASKNASLEQQTLHKTTSPQVHTITDTEVARVAPFESEKFNITDTQRMVGWYDPQHTSQDLRPKTNKSAMIYPGTPHFSISCSDDARRDRIIAQIIELGGTVSKNLANVDIECSHILCERPNRGEKIMGCIAAGKWVLNLMYIDICYAEQAFINEEPYQWGNPKSINMPELTADEHTIAKAAYDWHQKLINRPRQGAFTGLRVILRISERTHNALKNVIRAGGGEVIEANSPYGMHNNANLATNCILDAKKMPLSKADFNFLKKHKVLITTSMYINAFLMNIGVVDLTKYQINP